MWGDRFAGIHLHVMEDRKFILNLVVIERDGDDFSVVDSALSKESLDDAKRIVEQGIPVSLVITGKGVIYKRIARNEGGESQQIRDTVEEYGNSGVAHSVTYNEHWLHLNLMRTEEVDFWKGEVEKAGIIPVWLDLGAASGWNILQHLNEVGSVRTGLFEYTFEETGLSGIEKAEGRAGQYSLDNDRLDGEVILPYASVISLLNAPATGSRKGNHLTSNADDAYYGKAIKKAGVVLMASLFAVLLINAGLFMHYHEKSIELTEQLSSHRSKLLELEQLRSGLEQKRQIATVSGSGTHGDFAYFSDKVVAELGSGIVLSRLTLNPFLPEDPRSERIAVKSNVMEVEGNCRESEALNAWINRLETLEEIGSVTILDLGKTRGNSESQFLMEIIFIG